MAYGVWHWRNSARTARFFIFDARAAIFICIAFLHLRPWTLVLAIIGLIFFGILERFGLTFPAAIRKFRLFLIGTRRPAWVKDARRKMEDYG